MPATHFLFSMLSQVYFDTQSRGAKATELELFMK